MPAFIKSYSQSQARLMFVATLRMDNFDCTKMHISKTSQLVYGRGSFTSGSNFTSPTSPPYVDKQLTALFHTQPPFSSLGCQSVAPTINCAF